MTVIGNDHAAPSGDRLDTRRNTMQKEGIGALVLGSAWPSPESASAGLTRAAESRYVTVKGLAERGARRPRDLADHVQSGANDLTALPEGDRRGRATTTAFLLDAGFGEDEISYPRRASPTRRRSGRWDADPDAVPIRRRRDRDDADEEGRHREKSMEKAAALVGKGIALSAQNWETPTEFLFTSLNTIKPEMIEEATIDGRKAAEKFARDSGSKAGKIRHATQGYFSIEDRDRNSPEVKNVRVVTTIGTSWWTERWSRDISIPSSDGWPSLVRRSRRGDRTRDDGAGHGGAVAFVAAALFVLLQAGSWSRSRAST
jgi:hypothetical protein